MHVLLLVFLANSYYIGLWPSHLKHAMQSNFDRRRINGPEESYPPVYVDEDEAESSWKPGQSRPSGVTVIASESNCLKSTPSIEE